MGKRNTRPFATSSSAPSTSCPDIRRSALDSWVLRSSRRLVFHLRRRFDRWYGNRCQNIGCYGDSCQNNGGYDNGGRAIFLDDQTETMTSSTLLAADVVLQILPTRKNLRQPPSCSSNENI